MAIIGTLPISLSNGTLGDASQVMADFNYIVSQVNANAAPLLSLASYLPLAGGTMTGPVTTTRVLVSGSSGPSGLLTLSDTTSSNGVNIKMTGDGVSTPSKSIRVAGGIFQLVNDAYSTTIFQVNDVGNVLDGTGNQLGYIALPPASVTTGAFVATDRGKCVNATAGVTVPNSTMSAGDVVYIDNQSGGAITITATVTTLTLAGTATTGNRTLAANGFVTIKFRSAISALIFGVGLT